MYKTTVSDLSYEELKSVCLDLQQQVTRFMAVEQNLVKVKSSLDKEISRFKLIQTFSEQARQIQNAQQLSQLCVETVIELYEVECAFVLEIIHAAPLMVKIVAQHGLEKVPHYLPIDECWFRERHTAFLAEGGDPILQFWKDLDLKQLVACPVFMCGERSKASMLLCAGRGRRYEQYYEPLKPELLSSFEVLSRQIEGIFQNLQAHEVIQRQVDQLKALGQLKEQANRMKDEFLATLSHELRTPLNVIQGHVEILLHDRDNISQEQIQHSLEAIERSTNSQTQIISDLLDVSRIVAGKLSFSPQLVNPLQIMALTIKSLASIADSKGIEIVISADPNLSHYIEADPTRLQQIIWNLLSNAIKFTPHGGKIFVDCGRVGSNCMIKIKDTGLGISPLFLPYVFDRFKQEDSSSTRKFGGLGLGLSIVKHLAELHGGTVTAFSDGKGRGSEFTVLIPLGAGKKKTPLADENRTLSSEIKTSINIRLDNVRVLLVDDCEDNRDLVSLILTKAGALVEEAGSAEEARVLLQKRAPDVIVSDIGMPGENGLMFIEKLRKDQNFMNIPIPAVALTAYVRSEEVQQILKAGFQAHISKPVSRHTLIESVYSLVQPRH